MIGNIAVTQCEKQTRKESPPAENAIPFGTSCAKYTMAPGTNPAE